MDDDFQELKKVRSETHTTESTCNYLVTITVLCPGNATIVLDRVKGLLGLVLDFLLANPIDYENEPAGFAIDPEYWKGVLPSWFLECTPFEVDDNRVENLTNEAPGSRWTVGGWLYWFLSPNEDRFWRWWDASIRDADCLEIRLAIRDHPFPWGVLQHAILSAGAESARLTY